MLYSKVSKSGKVLPSTTTPAAQEPNYESVTSTESPDATYEPVSRDLVLSGGNLNPEARIKHEGEKLYELPMNLRDDIPLQEIRIVRMGNDGYIDISHEAEDQFGFGEEVRTALV